MYRVTQNLNFVILIVVTMWMCVDMKDNIKESSGSKWDTLNQMFVINQLANQAYSEIYKHKTDPWKVYRKKCTMMYQIDNSLNVYLLFQELYDKLKIPEKQIITRYLGQ